MAKIRGTRSAAKYLKCSLQTIARLVSEGKLVPAEKVELSEQRFQYVFLTESLDICRPHLRSKGRPKRSGNE
jgi:hypothetical protein